MSRKIALIAASLVVVLAVDVSLILLHDEATPYDAQQALTDFRRQPAVPPGPQATSSVRATAVPTAAVRPRRTGPAPSANAGVPAPSRSTGAGPQPAPTTGAAGGEVRPGVYRYATSGYEEVDALGGARHDYPAQTAVSYRPGGCGSEDRWQPLRERYSLNTLCRGPQGLEARRSVQRREFFGQSEEQVLVCAPGLVLVPDDPRPGRTFSGTCRSDDTVVTLTVRVVGESTVAIGSRSVQAIHVRVDGTLTGSTRGTTQREEWFTKEGLLLRGTGTTETDRDTSPGTVHYSETFDIRLESLEPQR